jgi:hypothetical protein
MALNDYHIIEFGVGFENGNHPAILNKISINDSVREALHGMKEAFDNHYLANQDPPTLFELTEKYGPTEKLTYPLVQAQLPELFDLYTNSGTIAMNDVNLGQNLASISFYFAVFHHINGTRSIGVKRPGQFKGLLQKKVMHFLNDSLTIIPDNLFKLDSDFDFFINQNTIDILHPSGFLYISGIDAHTLAHAEQATNALAQRINFINFAHIAPLVAQKVTAARLISSIKARQDLENTNEQKLIDKCIAHGVGLHQVGNLMAPVDNDLIAFLQILDRRLYDYDLLDNNTEQYLASSRKRKP